MSSSGGRPPDSQILSVARGRSGSARRRSRRTFPTAEVHRSDAPARRIPLDQERIELAARREAGRLTGVAVIEAMRSTEPGVFEYE